MSHESAILDPVSNAPQLTVWMQRACAQIHETANEAWDADRRRVM